MNFPGPGEVFGQFTDLCYCPGRFFKKQKTKRQ